MSARRPRSLFRYSPHDAWFVGLALLHAGLLGLGLTCLATLGGWGALAFAATFALATCWSSNTVSHNHLHKPLFRVRSLNVALSWLLTLIMGVPQSLWRARHFWHHAGEPERARTSFISGPVVAEGAAILLLWSALLAHSPRVLLTAYFPGYVLGLLLCLLQGQMEHARTQSATRGVSYYGGLYNALWFNDGYHAEHHRFPSEHWTRLPARTAEATALESAWPPLLRWLEPKSADRGVLQATLLALLERIALGSTLTQRFMLWSHERAFRRLLSPEQWATARIAIVGGGLFPRTALVLRKILPLAKLTIIDRSAASLTTARQFLARRCLDDSELQLVHAAFSPELAEAHDVVVAPLAYVGDCRALRAMVGARPLVVHEWLWQRSSRHTTVVSWLLLKRLSLVRARGANES